MSHNPSHLSTLGLKPGDKVGKYEIVEKIGVGGMSIVWKAVDRLLDRQLAIKQINYDPATGGNVEAFRERFRTQAQIQRRLAEHHKHLVKVHEFLEDPRGLFIVMELVPGQTLEQYLTANPAPLDQNLALGIIGATAMALSAIHKADVIHRDLKPSNILLPTAGGLKVADFGLAALIEDQESLTVGSVRYMAPEAFSGEPVDPRADIYSLGMIAYELLAGRDKFNEAFKIVLRDQRNQSMRWMKWHTSPRAAVTPLHQLNPSVPQKLSDLVARMMEKDRNQRIPSADELLQAIRRHFAGHSDDLPATAADTSTGPALSAEPTAQLPKRNRLSLILTALLVFWLVVGLVAWWMIDHQKSLKLQQNRKAAVAQYQEAKALFDKQDYDGSLPVFQRIAKDWAHDDRLSRFSRVHILFAQAEQLFQDNQYEQAAELYQQTDQALTTPTPIDVLDRNLVRNRRNLAEVRLNADKQIAKIDALRSQGKFDDARFERSEFIRLSKLELTDQQKKKLDNLGSQIDREERTARINERLTQAEEMVKVGRRDDAILFLDKVAIEFGDSNVRSRSQALQRERELDQLVTLLDKAERNRNWPQAIDYAQRAVQLSTNHREYQRRIQRYQSNLSYEQGQRQEQAGELDAARASYLNAVEQAKRNEDRHEQAEQALARLKTANERQSLISAGDKAVADGNYDLAMSQYQRALDMAPDSSVSTKLRTTQLSLLLQQVRTAANDNKLDVARSTLAEVFKIDPDNQAAKDEAAKLDKRNDYLRHLARGDELRQLGKYGEAALEFRRARTLLDTPEIKQRQDDNEYDSLLASAKRDLETENWKAAQSWLMTAQRIRNTAEVQQLLTKVNENLPKATTGE